MDFDDCAEIGSSIGMSQITRCPACHTVFKVVQDQLRMSGGWVRCGQCTEVFDATLTLAASAADLSTIELAMQAAAMAPVAAAVPEQLDPPVSVTSARLGQPGLLSPELAPIDVPDDATLRAMEVSRGNATRPESGGADPGVQPIEPVLLPESVPDSVPEPDRLEQRVPQGVVSEAPVDIPRVVSADAVARSAMSAVSSTELPDPSLPNQAEISFLRDAAGAAPQESRLKRVVKGVLALVLMGVLAVQLVVMERDRLAAMFPQTKPALRCLCDQLACKLAPWRQIESIVIDSSSFNKLRGDSYRLLVGLRNTSSVDVAIPSIELTLTDSQDQALFRRVLTPEELARPGAVQAELPAGADWQGQASIAIRMPATAERFTGYKVLAFYP